MTRFTRLALASMAGGALIVAVVAAPPGQLSPAERRGKEIYVKGTSSSGGQITATMGEAGIEVPASVLPCVNCHGPDGRGRPEGGVSPTDIRWRTLTKPYGVRLRSGREHPPYQFHHLKRAIGMGLDSAGNRLHLAMPRYRMSVEDMDDLTAYCRKLGRETDPGLTADTLRVGVLLPPQGRLEAVGEAIRSALSAYFDELNGSGGIHGRKLELAIFTLPSDRNEARRRIDQFLSRQPVFALVGAFAAGLEEEVSQIALERGLPVVGPFTLHPRLGFPLNRYVFYIFPGLATQARAMVDFISPRLADRKPKAAVIYPETPDYEEAARALVEEARKRGWTDLTVHSYPFEAFQAPLLADKLGRAKVEVVFFLDRGDRAVQFLSQAHRLGWRPWTLAAGSLTGEAILQAPESFQDRIFLSLPALPGQQVGKRFQELTVRHGLPAGHRATQLSTLAAAEIFAEGLKRAGRDLSREKLTDALEELHEFDTGFTPLISFGPNRRVGARGAYLAIVDLKRRTVQPAAQWTEVRQ